MTGDHCDPRRTDIGGPNPTGRSPDAEGGFGRRRILELGAASLVALAGCNGLVGGSPSPTFETYATTTADFSRTDGGFVIEASGAGMTE